MVKVEKNFWKEKNVFVTGATGLVGSHISERLISLGANVIALVRSKNPKSYFYSEGLDKKVVISYGDLKSFDKLYDIITRYEVDIIFHLAAQPIVTKAILNPLETFKTNIMGTVNILEAARRAESIKSVIVASSDKAYGKSLTLPYKEEMPLIADAPYDISKSCADLISLSYAKTYNMPIAVIRCGNIFGPGDLNFDRIVPGTIKAGITNSVLNIRSDGKMIREYIYIEDVVNAYIMVGERIEKAKGEAFNVGSGEKLRVLEVVEKISKIMKKKIKIKILNIAKNEIPEQYLSSEKIKKMIGWKCLNSFDEGIKKTIPWYKKLFSRKIPFNRS